jgi:hypothetical protein
MFSLSIIIPGRVEEYMAQTVRDVLAHTGPRTEVIAVIDGEAAGEHMALHPRLRILTLPAPVGQRAAQNVGVRASSARYVMKLDAHCAVDENFDEKLLAVMADDITLVPVMRNLWVYNWVCDFCGATEYQGPRPGACKECDSDASHFQKVLVWNPKPNPASSAYRFNKTLQFKYFPELRERQGRTGLQETMSLQGSCFMANREAYWAKELCDEAWGSWGQQGSEVALKTWLSGGRVMCCMDTWYAHQFRTKAGDAFPYGGVSASQLKAREISQDVFLNDKWPKQTRPLLWLMDRFWPALREVRDEEARWEEIDLLWLKEQAAKRNFAPLPPSRGIIYYTDGELPEAVAAPVRERIQAAARLHRLPIVTAALKRRLAWGDKNIVFPRLQRGQLAMFTQILGALENSTADIIFFCEHDVLYDPSHFEFIPPDAGKVYYNLNWWQADAGTGRAATWEAKRVSQLCGYRDTLIAHYRRRVALVKERGYSAAMGYEPGSHSRAERVDDLQSETWRSLAPNVDLRHSGNLSAGKWSLADFRTPPTGWQEADSVPGWDLVAELGIKVTA